MKGKTRQILLVDDEEKFIHSIAKRLELMGFELHTATSGFEAIDIALMHHIDMAIVDLQMPGMDGLVTITKLREIYPELKTVLLTGYGNEKVRQATESLNTLYFQKENMGELWGVIKNLNPEGSIVVIRPPGARGDGFAASDGMESGAHAIAEAVGISDWQKERSARTHLLKIVGETAVMQRLRKTIERIAPLGCAVLLSGEDGTGKELAARKIHRLGSNDQQRFLAIDCKNTSNENFVEQLIGTSDGDLLNAILNRKGIFGAEPLVGTLFFDCVEEAPPSMQQQLIKTIDGIGRLQAGGDKPAKPLRVLISTQTNLKQRISTHGFDEALYGKLNTCKLSFPPLRERKDDILLLCSYFIRKSSIEYGREVEDISSQVVEIFSSYDFPGNVRELSQIIERAVIMADGRIIEKKHLPQRFQDSDTDDKTGSLGAFLSLAELEEKHIRKVVSATGGNKSKAAEILGISRAALWRKLKHLEGK